MNKSGATQDYHLHLACPADYAEVAAVYTAAALSNLADREFLLAHPEALVLSHSEWLSKDSLLICAPQKVLGFASWSRLDTASAELSAIFVLPSHHRLGLATRLLNQLCSNLRQQQMTQLYVTANHHAQAFYLAYGFKFLHPVATDFAMAERYSLSLMD